jgi:hypothetical protein
MAGRPLRRRRNAALRRNGWRGNLRAVIHTYLTDEEIEDALAESSPWDDEGVEVYESGEGIVIISGQVKVHGSYYDGADGKREAIEELVYAVLENAGDEDPDSVHVTWSDW